MTARGEKPSICSIMKVRSYLRSRINSSFEVVFADEIGFVPCRRGHAEMGFAKVRFDETVMILDTRTDLILLSRGQSTSSL